MAYTVTFIPGDGTGPELAEAVRRVLEATGVEFEWDWQEAGADTYEREGTPLPDRVLESIKRNKVAIKAPITTPVGSGFRSVNVALRKDLDRAQSLHVVATSCGTAQPPAVRLRQEHGNGHEVSARKPGVADLLVQLVRRLRVKDGFVDVAQRCKCAREGRLHDLNSPAFLPFSPG